MMSPLSLAQFGFVALCVLYDMVDFACNGTVARLSSPYGVQALQLGLIATQLLALRAIRRNWITYQRCLLIISSGLRFAECAMVPLNDFLFMGVFIACMGFFPQHSASQQRLLLQLLRWQLAWVYAATAWLKCSPVWCLGHELFVRQGYLWAAHGWWFPAWYLRAWWQPGFLMVLANVGLACEFALAALLLMFSLAKPPTQPWLAIALVGIGTAIHGFAAVSLNVWFFGPMMVWLLYALSRPSRITAVTPP